LRVNVTFR